MLDYCKEELSLGDHGPLFNYYSSVHSNHIDSVYVRAMPNRKRTRVYEKIISNLEQHENGLNPGPLTLDDLGIVTLPKGATI